MTYASPTDEPCQTGARVIRSCFVLTLSLIEFVIRTWLVEFVRGDAFLNPITCLSFRGSEQQIHQKIRICITTDLYVSIHMYVYAYINIRYVVKTWAQREDEWLFDQRLKCHIQHIYIFMCTSYWIYRSISRGYVSILRSRLIEHVLLIKKELDDKRMQG